MGSRLGVVPSARDGTLAQRLLKSETHRTLGFNTRAAFPRNLTPQRPLVQSSALLEGGEGTGACLFLPPQTQPFLHPHCRNLCPGSSTPQSSSPGESLSRGRRGLGSAEGCRGNKVG